MTDIKYADRTQRMRDNLLGHSRRYVELCSEVQPPWADEPIEPPAVNMPEDGVGPVERRVIAEADAAIDAADDGRESDFYTSEAQATFVDADGAPIDIYEDEPVFSLEGLLG